MDSIAICILRRAICICINFQAIWTQTLNPSGLEKKNLLHRNNMHILHACCTSQYAYCNKKKQHAYCDKKIRNFKSKRVNLVKHIPRHPQFAMILPLPHECRQQPLKKINPTTHTRPAKINPRIAARPLNELIRPLWAKSKGFQYIPRKDPARAIR